MRGKGEDIRCEGEENEEELENKMKSVQLRMRVQWVLKGWEDNKMSIYEGFLNSN